MPTRQQAEFERSLVEALSSSNVATAISEAIITNITKKLAQKFNYYDAKIASLEAEIQLLKTANNKPENKTNEKLEQKMDNLQQQTKNNNIRLMGIKEVDKENTISKVKEIIVSKLKVPIDDNEIICAYRVGQNSNERPRHIIVTLKDIKTKSSIYNKKKLLKGTGVIMKEDLTANRLKMVKEASDKYGFKNVWTSNGNIFAKTATGVEKIFSSKSS